MATVNTVKLSFELDALTVGTFTGTVTITSEAVTKDQNDIVWMPESLVYDLSTVSESDGLLPTDQSTPGVLYTIIVEGGNASPVVLVHQQLNYANAVAGVIPLSSLIS